MNDFLKDQIDSMNHVLLAGMKAGQEIEQQSSQARIAALENALQWVIPMAKGYAAEHPVGRNPEIVSHAEQVLSEKVPA